MSYQYFKRQLTKSTIAFVYDPGVEPAWGRLRVLPAIRYVGVRHFTMPKRWRQLSSVRQYDYLDYEYELLGDIDLDDESLCSITSQNYESHTEYTIMPLLYRYQHRKEPFIVVAHERDFDPQGGQRELQEQPFVTKVGSYQTLYEQFTEHYATHGLDCPLHDTKNLYLQDNANIYELVTGEQLSTTIELFERLPEAPYLPLYGVFVDIFAREDEPGASPLPSYQHIEALGRWLRRRIEWDRQTGLYQARRLNRLVDQDERIFDVTTRMRSHLEHNITEALSTMKSANDDIHNRYEQWLQEVAR